MRSTKAVIYLDNLRDNLKTIRVSIRHNVKMCIAVKADAYGHGAVPVARMALECGADYLAVATVDEGIELRTAGILSPILVLSLCTPAEMPSVVCHNLTPLVSDEEYISLFEKAVANCGKKKFPLHLAIDTGMGRIGCLPGDAVKIAKLISASSSLYLEGMCTHFAVSDSTDSCNRDYTYEQFKAFTSSCDAVRSAGIDPGIRHCSSSAALLDRPDMQLDMARAGIITYGYYPDEITEKYLTAGGRNVHLNPLWPWKLKSLQYAALPLVSPFHTDELGLQKQIRI